MSPKLKKQLLQVTQNIYDARIAKEMSQDALAKKAGVDRKTVNRIENGHFSPSLETYFRICAALSIKPKEMLS